MKRHLTTFDLALGALCLVMLAGMALLGLAGVSGEAETYEGALHDLIEVDATLNRDLLRIAIGDLRHYDTLVEASRELRRIDNRLNREPAGLGDAEVFNANRLNVSILLAEKLELLEVFKTAHAEALAAQDYFPKLLATSDRYRAAGGGLSREDISHLFGTTAHYLQEPGPERESELNSQLDALTARVESVRTGEPDSDLVHLLERIRAIVEGKKNSRVLYEELAEVPLAEAGAHLAAAFGTAYRAQQRGALYWFSGLMSLLILVLAAFAAVPRIRGRRREAAAAEEESALKEALKEARAKSAYLRRDEEQEAARLAEERHAALVRHAFEVMAILSRQDHYIYVSPACETLFGLTQKELIGKSFYEGIHTDDLIKVEDYFMRAQKEFQVEETVQYRVMDAYGRWYLVESFASNQSSNPAVRGMVLNTRILHTVEAGKPTPAR